MARRGPRRGWQVVLLLVAAAILWWLDFQPAADVAKSGAYETYRGCQWVDHRQNDGDSFRVRLPDGRVEQFRLYFVDAPESDFRSYAGGRTNHRRIHEQAAAFGISAVQAVEIGKQAKKLVHELLGRGTFTVHTAWDDPFGDRRFHAFIVPEDAPMIHELLVDKGLARIHSKPSELPDGTGAKEHLRALREMEQAAKRMKQGAWGQAEHQ